MMLSISGTGVERVPLAAWGNDYISLSTPDLMGSTSLRVRSDNAGHFELFVPSSAFYELNVFDPETGLIGKESGITSPSGQWTPLVGTMVFEASDSPDSDYDGLPDDIELAIGTSAHRRDSDGNGLDDFAEIQQGLDPLGGRAFPTGILAQLRPQGEVKQIVVAGATPTNQAELAYLATGSHGLAIVDVSRFAAPVLLAELDLPGDATDVAYDSTLQRVVVATGAGGLHLVDVSNPSAPALLRTLDIQSSVVEVKDGVAFAADGHYVRALDLRGGEFLDRV
jgi:hypothetical protein